MKIVGYTSYESNYPTMNLHTQEEFKEFNDCFLNEFKEKGYIYSGYTHQNSPFGVPVFDDGTAFRCSLRQWVLMMFLVYRDIIDDSKVDEYALKIENEKTPSIDASCIIQPSSEKSRYPYQSRFDSYYLKFRYSKENNYLNEIGLSKEDIEDGNKWLNLDKSYDLAYKDYLKPMYEGMTSTYKVIGWTNYDSSYPDVSEENDEEAFKALILDIRKNGYRFGGMYHQGGKFGTPVFQDGTCYRASERAFSRYMAIAYNIKDKHGNYDYMAFFPYECDNPKYPDIDAKEIIPCEEKAKEEDDLSELDFGNGVSFLTLDKTLKKK